MMKFAKMHGLGNDFVVVDATEIPFDLSQTQIQQLANRRLGVGFDQLLVLERAQQAGTDFHMRVFNADGSEVGQCGNGARCIAHFIHLNKLSEQSQLAITTITEKLSLMRQTDGQVSVKMGVPHFAPAEIPFRADKAAQQYTLTVDNQPVTFSVANVGNPHAVIQVEAIDCHYVSAIGKALSENAAFPESVNVGFMQIIDSQHIRLQVYERGTGETLACGSGACAAMAVGRRNGWLNERVSVNQPGGNLQIDWSGPSEPIVMTGPAQLVYFGQLQI